MQSNKINEFIKLLSDNSADKALNLCNEILEENSDDHTMYNLLGVIYLKFKLDQKGLELLNKAIELKPDFGDGYKNLGVYYLEKSPSQSLTYFQKALQYSPKDSDLYFNIANIFTKKQKYDLAKKYYLQTIKLNPKNYNAKSNLGSVCYLLKEFLDASEHFIALNKEIPDNPTILTNLAASLAGAGRLEESEKIYKELYSKNITNDNYYINYCNLCIKLNKIDEAINLGIKAVSINPDNFLAQNNLGYAYFNKKDYKKAKKFLLQAIKLNPKTAEAYNNLGNIFLAENNWDQAKVFLEKALKLDPKLDRCHFSLGNLYVQKDVYKAIEYYKHSLEINPGYLEAYNNLATSLLQIDNFEESINYNKTGLKIDPKNIGFKLNLARIHLKLQNFEEGWKLYKARLEDKHIQQYIIPKTDKPMWDGSSLKNKTIYIYYEQGFGDTINFIRYIQLIESLGARVILKIQKPLLRLFENSSLKCQLITDEDPIPDFDIHFPLMSLPGMFTTDINSIPPSNLKITFDQNYLNELKNDIFNDKNFKIGISWEGNKKHALDLYRSTKLEYFQPISNIDNITLYSLNTFPTKEDQNLLKSYNIIDLSQHITDFYDTACLIKNMDLIISIDSSIIHLAGILNIKTWLLLGSISDWRWFTNTSKAFWYKNIILFRHKKPNDWDSVFIKVLESLKKFS